MSIAAVSNRPAASAPANGQHADRAQRAPRREDEADGERKIPRTDLVRDVNRRALVGAEQQARYRQDELHDADRDEREPHRRREERPHRALLSRSRHDARCQPCGSVGTACAESDAPTRCWAWSTNARQPAHVRRCSSITDSSRLVGSPSSAAELASLMRLHRMP